MEEDDIESPLMEKKPSKPSAKLALLLADATDLFVLLCSFLLTAVSIALVALVFHFSESPAIWKNPGRVLSYLQRIISSLSLTITSAVIMVAGKRYVLSKIARGGLRSERIAVYSDPTIGNLTKYLVLRGVELPLLGLSVVWGLSLATGLTVDDTWKMGPQPLPILLPAMSGPLDLPLPTSDSSWVTPTLEQLYLVLSSSCLGSMGVTGNINVIGAGTDPDDLPTATIYYPPLSLPFEGNSYSFSTFYTMNGFNISMEPLSSVPSTALNLSICAQNSYSMGSSDFAAELWYGGSDNQTLSLIVVDNADVATSTFRINATAIIMGGTLSSYNNYTEFALNGTSWPNVMSAGNHWAQDIISVICNATIYSNVGSCESTSGTILNFASMLYSAEIGDLQPLDNLGYWSLVLNTALGAYSSAMFSSSSVNTTAGGTYTWATLPDVNFIRSYGTYILLLNIVVSTVLLIVVVRLRLASHLGPDFLNSTRLLLDPLKKPELFNASLRKTMDALADPYMLVEDNTLIIAEQKRGREREGRKWSGVFSLRKRSHST